MCALFDSIEASASMKLPQEWRSFMLGLLKENVCY